MIIFPQLEVIEGHLESELKRREPNIEISTLLQTLSSSSSCRGFEGEIFDLLFTLSDFSAFKREILEVKKVCAYMCVCVCVCVCVEID